MNAAILIARNLTQQEEDEVSHKANADNETVVFATQSFNLPATLHTVKFDLDPTAKRKVNLDIFNIFKDFAQKIVDGQTFYEYFTFGKAQLWFYHKYRIFFSTRDLAYESEMIRQLASQFDKVQVYSTRRDLHILHFDQERISFYFSNPKKPRLNWHSVFNYAITFLLRLFWGMAHAFGHEKARLAVIDSRDQYRMMLRPDCTGFYRENAFLGYAFEQFDERFVLIDQLILPKLTSRFPLKSQHWKNINGRSRWYEEYLLFRWFGFKELRSLLRWRKLLKQRLAQCDRSLHLKSFEEIIYKQFRALTTSSLFYLVKYLAYKRFFQKGKIEVATTCDENSPNFKLILDAAKSAGVITVGYQHGNIHALHPSYMYHKKDLELRPMPDYTLVWGERWKNLLVESGNFPSGTVRVTGQIRTDIIYKLRHTGRQVPTGLEASIKNKKIVLFASQPQRDATLRYRAAHDVFEATKDLPGVLLLFKMHPLERDPGFYEDIANKFHAQNYLLVQDIDLYLLLHLSEIVVTCFSTVGTEAVYFHKPLVILDHLKEDILHYIEEGVAFDASNSIELKTRLEGIFSNQLVPDTNIYKEYIRRYAFRIDGEASKRLVDFMTGLI